MPIIGFSTGAIARSDFRAALAMLRRHRVPAVELSALRLAELEPLCRAIPSLDLSCFDFVSVHAPSRFLPEDEATVVELLRPIAERHPIVVHPDVLFTPPRWNAFGSQLLVENMDKRKPVGRTVVELRGVFDALQAARFCFDIGHARQVDPSMTEAALLLGAYRHRLAEIHMSEVNTASRHDPISLNAVRAFAPLAHQVPADVPVIIESLIDQGQSDIQSELDRAGDVFAATAIA